MNYQADNRIDVVMLRRQSWWTPEELHCLGRDVEKDAFHGFSMDAGVVSVWKSL
jgi:hypothetical protein